MQAPQAPVRRRSSSPCRRLTCCSSATSPRPATRRPPSAFATGRASFASANSPVRAVRSRRGCRRLSPREARARGARSVIIGVANTGGILKPNWIPSLVEALEAGLDVVSGMHGKLAASTRTQGGRRRASAGGSSTSASHRQTFPSAPVASAAASDCSPSARIARSARNTRRSRSRARCAKRGIDADFRATGQTGIMIAGSGMPIDAVVSDFVAGAAEMPEPGRRARPLGRDRGPGLAVSPGLCRRFARPPARQPAGRHRALPRTGPWSSARLPGFPDALAAGCDRAAPQDGLADESEDPMRWRQLQHGCAGRRRGRARHDARIGIDRPAGRGPDPRRPGVRRLVEACLA